MTLVSHHQVYSYRLSASAFPVTWNFYLFFFVGSTTVHRESWPLLRFFVIFPAMLSSLCVSLSLNIRTVSVHFILDQFCRYGPRHRFYNDVSPIILLVHKVPNVSTFGANISSITGLKILIQCMGETPIKSVTRSHYRKK